VYNLFISLLIKLKHEKQQILSQVCSFMLLQEIINQYRPLLDAIELTYPQYLVMLILWEFESQTKSIRRKIVRQWYTHTLLNVWKQNYY
jgi:hypothetical protein